MLRRLPEILDYFDHKQTQYPKLRHLMCHNLSLLWVQQRKSSFNLPVLSQYIANIDIYRLVTRTFTQTSLQPVHSWLVSPKDMFCSWKAALGFPVCQGTSSAHPLPCLPWLHCFSHRNMLSRKCHCWEPVSRSKKYEFRETGAVLYYENYVQLSPRFLLCGCLFASFCQLVPWTSKLWPMPIR